MPHTPSGDALQDSTSLALRNLLQNHVIHFPVDAFDLLRLLIAHTPSVTELRANSYSDNDAKPWTPRLKLQDVAVFEGMLERWAERWDYGIIGVVKTGQESGGISVVGAQVTDPGGSRKRKRGEEDVKYGASCHLVALVRHTLNVPSRCEYDRLSAAASGYNDRDVSYGQRNFQLIERRHREAKATLRTGWSQSHIHHPTLLIPVIACFNKWGV